MCSNHGSILALAFSSDGKWLVSGSEDHTARLWDVERGRFVLTLPGHVGDVMSAAFLNTKGEQDLVVGDSAGVIRLWDLSVIGQREELTTLDGLTGGVTMIAFDPTAPMLASSSVDRSIDLWDVQADKLVKSFSNQPGSVSAVAFSPDGEYLASATKTSAVRLWDVKTGKERLLEDAKSEQIRHIAFSPNGRFLAAGSEDGKIRIWNVEQGSISRSFAGHTAKV